MNISFRDLIDLTDVIVWPFVVILLMGITFRKDLPKLAQALVSRISRFSAAGLKIEFASEPPCGNAPYT
mgnify:CR=1 FL=1